MKFSKINGAVIFKAGTWNKQTFSEADLDAIVQAFTDASKAGRVPLKFGHAEDDDDQPFREGMPALGWVAKIWRVGKDLMADFIDIPTVVFESIRKGLYKFTSIELLKNVEYDGKRFPYLLDAVALLGAEPPAVDGVSDLQRLALSRTSFKFSEALAFTAERSIKVSKFTAGDSTTMTPEEIQAAIAKGIAEGTKKNQEQADKDSAERKKFADDNAALKLKLDEQAKAIKTDKVKLARDSATAIIEAAVRAKKITPAQRISFTKLFKLEDDDAVLALDLKDVELHTQMTQDDARKVLAEGKSAFSKDPGKGEGESAVDDPGEDHSLVTDMYTRSLKRSREEKIDIFSAMEKVVREDPKLGQRFLAYVYENDQAA